ncbi:MAG: FAD-dependent oxidoreductase [Coriobacteriales bacterium]|nr:FAD-dependent oxidoreductase [Coriobacteriales bacterium]MBQ6585427.1 FAD-dependent oxidoreductase [Coriobacteriales bacterium]
MNTQFPKLLEPGTIGRWDLPNRIVMAPMGTLNADKDGFITERSLRFYIEQAKGRMGIIFVECTFIDEFAGKGEENSQMITRQEHVTGLARLASAIKDHGVKAVLQLNHMGKQITLHDRPSMGPSTMNEMMGGIMPFPITGMSKAEIRKTIEQFGIGAKRAMQAGFDGVEIHGAINHLIAMFCSPFYNHRTDEYGGSPENRARFYKEIIEEIQKQCGKGFPIVARLCGDECSPDGLTLEEGVAQALILEKTGIVAFHIMGGDYRNVKCINAQYDPRGDFKRVAKAFKDAGIKIPIILDGGFTTPDIAEQALEEGVCDYIGLGRPIIADPYWAVKLREGRPEDIKPCIRCTKGCVGTMATFDSAYGLRCSVNPQCNMAGIRDINPITRVKRVGIIGGGPAGLEAACLLRQRGHEVDLYEKRKLGGTMNEAAFDQGIKGDISNLIKYYESQVAKNGTNVIESEATAAQVIDAGYDAVIVATGAQPLPPRVKGSDEFPGRIMSAYDYATHAAELEMGDTVLIIGGCFMNLEMAYSLLKQGKTVIVSSRRGLRMGIMELGDDNSSPQQQRLSILMGGYMRTGKLQFKYGHSINRATATGIVLNSPAKQEVEVKCDDVIVCRGYRGRPKIYDEIREAVPETYLVGDATMRLRCDDKRVIHDAITDAWGIANNI